MKTINYCVCCGSARLEVFPATMWRFVIDRMTGGESNQPLIKCRYVHCLDCSFAGSDLRFSQEEEFRYYKNYMKEEYINHRCSYDEGYGLRGILNFLNTEQYKEMRRMPITQVLQNVLDFSKIESVLDFGGDTGELIPNELAHAKKFVTDVESRAIGNGVISVTSPSESGLVDLVICGHTLEHVSYPMELIKNLKSYLKPGGWIYLEIPKERDGNYEPDHQFHEHINHFNFKCLEYILKANGFVNLEGIELDYEQHVGTAYVVTGQLA